MPLDKSGLIGLLTAVDEELEKKITLVAAGGTAMTLLDLKPSTIDIDFTGPKEDIEEFNRIQKSIPHGFKVDILPRIHSSLSPVYLEIPSASRNQNSRTSIDAENPADFVFHLLMTPGCKLWHTC